MPRLSNPKHERFALSLSEGKNITNSYVDAYRCDRKTAGSCVSRLKRNAVHGQLIAARVAELQTIRAQKEADAKAVAAGQVQISRGWIMQKLQQVAEDAIQAGQRAPAARALELLGKEIGMFASEREPPNLTLGSLSLDDLIKLSEALEADPELADDA